MDNTGVVDIYNPTDQQKREMLAGYNYAMSLTTCPFKRMLADMKAQQYLIDGIAPQEWTPFLDKVSLSEWIPIERP